MKIVKHPPITRGVTELMYVGDDQAVEKAVAMPSTMELALGAAGVYAAFRHRDPILRIFGAGIAFSVGYRAFQAKTQG
jgi:hypothetical protein